LLKTSDKCLICSAESEVGCHSILNGDVVSKYYCVKCYNKETKKLGRPKKDEGVSEIQDD